MRLPYRFEAKRNANLPALKAVARVAKTRCHLELNRLAVAANLQLNRLLAQGADLVRELHRIENGLTVGTQDFVSRLQTGPFRRRSRGHLINDHRRMRESEKRKIVLSLVRSGNVDGDGESLPATIHYDGDRLPGRGQR